MAKKGFFSWFRKDKPVPEVEEQQLQVDIDAEREVEAEQVNVEQVNTDKLTEEQLKQTQAEEAAYIEQERLAVEREAQDNIDQQRLVAEKLAADQLAAEQLALEQQAAELARLETEKLAAEQVKRQQAEEADRLEQDRLEAEQVEQARIDAEVLADEALAAEMQAVEPLTEQQAPIEHIALEKQDEPQAKPQKEGMFARLKRGLMRTSENIGSGFIGLFSGKKIDDELFEELEEQLLIADVGVETTTKLIKSLTEHASRKQLKNAEALYDLMREEMQKMLDPVAVPLIPDNANGPFVILMVGVNGVGKTTTIGKLAKQYQSQGKSVMLAAGDTFRAAAVEQLQVWGQRNNIPVVAQHTGADSASVLFDALQAAKARKVDVLIADTAGRLQNKSHLMEELKKVVRVMKKLDPDTPHEVMLTLDASTGQNAISQAQLFQEAVGVTGITISKLDGTAKGGVIFAIADKFTIPIRHIGVGEQIDDLRTFNANDFIEALFSQDKTDQ
ncbi:signal recognition particle-docking protein FtsY [Shewanella sp. A14]